MLQTAELSEADVIILLVGGEAESCLLCVGKLYAVPSRMIFSSCLLPSRHLHENLKNKVAVI